MNTDYVILPITVGISALLIVIFCVRRIRALRAGRYSRLRQRTGYIALPIVCVLVVVIAASSLLNAVALQWFWRSNPPAANSMVLVGPYRMHISCLGAGSPTLVLESGLGDDSLIWSGLQEKLAQTTRVCSYDKAGFGWSDSRPGIRDADHIATELHALLSQSGIRGPLMLMGHSIGGLYIRDYAAHYPEQVKGLIFIDSSSPLQDRNPAFVAGRGSGPPAWLFRAAMVAGIPRVIGMCSGGKPGPWYTINRQRGEHTCGLHYHSISAESDSFDRSGEEVLRTRSYGSLPILVVSHDPAKMLQAHSTAKDLARQKAWSDMQAQLKSLSTDSRQIIAVGADHYVMSARSDLLEKEVPLFIQYVRGAMPPTLPNGVTVRE